MRKPLSIKMEEVKFMNANETPLSLNAENQVAAIGSTRTEYATGGRKSSRVESVSWLVYLPRNSSVYLAPEEHVNVDAERAIDKFSNGYVRITLMPVRIPLVSKRRVFKRENT